MLSKLSEPDLTYIEVFSNPTPPITGQQAFFNTDLGETSFVAGSELVSSILMAFL
jgi:hypothetical protein